MRKWIKGKIGGKEKKERNKRIERKENGHSKEETAEYKKKVYTKKIVKSKQTKWVQKEL